MLSKFHNDEICCFFTYFERGILSTFAIRIECTELWQIPSTANSKHPTRVICLRSQMLTQHVSGAVQKTLGDYVSK